MRKDVDADADLFELRRLLEDARYDAGAMELQTQHEAADARTDDRYIKRSLDDTVLAP